LLNAHQFSKGKGKRGFV